MKIKHLIPMITLTLGLGVLPSTGQADLKANTERLNRYMDQLRDDQPEIERLERERIEREREARLEREKQARIERERQARLERERRER